MIVRVKWSRPEQIWGKLCCIGPPHRSTCARVYKEYKDLTWTSFYLEMTYLWPSVIQPWLTMKKLISSWSVHVLKDEGFICCSEGKMFYLLFTFWSGNALFLWTGPSWHSILHTPWWEASCPGNQILLCNSFWIKIRLLITFGYVQFQGSWHLASSQELHSKQSIAVPAEMKEFLSLSLSLFASCV